ncbi:glycosyl hydrolase, partial [Mesorhizobium sp. M7A.F.Ca.CA.001.11.2.1]
MSFRLAIVAACLLATAAPASADFLWGINGHPIVSYPGIPVERQLDFIKDLGLKSYRVNVSGVDNADMLSNLVDAGKARGIEILPVITPAVADLDKDSPEELYASTRKLAVTLATRFKNDIRVWELGNEMENYAIIKPCEKRDDGSQYPCAWGPAGGTGPLDYYGPRWVKVSAVLKGLSDGMTEVDPSIRKAMGTAGWGHTGAFVRMKQDGIAWDISVWHMYGDDPEWAFREISRYGKPIWVTEFNNPYGSQRSERQQADGIKQTMTRLSELKDKYKVEAAHIYELLDEAYWAPGFEANMGLVRLVALSDGKWRTGEPKPAYKTVRDFTRGPLPIPKPHRDCDP